MKQPNALSFTHPMEKEGKIRRRRRIAKKINEKERKIYDNGTHNQILDDNDQFNNYENDPYDNPSEKN